MRRSTNKKYKLRKRAAILGLGVTALAGLGATIPSVAVAQTTGTSFGSVDVAAQTVGDNVVVAGWAIDPDSTSPISVAIYVDGVATTNVVADGSRTDVGAAYPAYGSDHGFTTTLDLGATGSHTIDVYAIDSAGNGDNPLLARKTVNISTTAFGAVDVAAQTSGNDVQVAGWAIDPDTASPILVAIYVDGVATKIVTADSSRTDVGAAYAAFGSDHGFNTTVTLASTGSHTIDVYAIDSLGNSDNPLLGRKTVSFVLV